MDRVLPGENLPRALSFSNTGILQGIYGIIYRSDPGSVCDVQIIKFQKKTSRAAGRRIQNIRLDGHLTLIAITIGKFE